MSLIDDILSSSKIQKTIQNNSTLKTIYGRLQNKKTEKQNSLTEEEKVDEKYKFTEIIKTESITMSEQEKTTILKPLLNLDETFPQLNGTDNNKYTELEFFTSNQQSVEPFFNKIDKTQTTVGRLHLQNIILHPKTDFKILNERKRIIEHFHSSEEKTKQLIDITDKIKELKEVESDVLWFFRQSSEEVNNMYSMVYFNNFWNKWVNKNHTLLNLFYYAKLIIIPLYGLLVPIFILVVPFLIITKILKLKIPFKAYWSIIKKLYFSGGGITKTMKGFFNMYENMKSKKMEGGAEEQKTFFSLTNLIIKLVKIVVDSNFSKILYYLFIGGTYLYNIYSTLNFSYAYLKIIHMFQSKLCRVSKWIRTAQDIFNSVGCLDCNELKKQFEWKINFKHN